MEIYDLLGGDFYYRPLTRYTDGHEVQIVDRTGGTCQRSAKVTVYNG